MHHQVIVSHNVILLSLFLVDSDPTLPNSSYIVIFRVGLELVTKNINQLSLEPALLGVGLEHMVIRFDEP